MQEMCKNQPRKSEYISLDSIKVSFVLLLMIWFVILTGCDNSLFSNNIQQDDSTTQVSLVAVKGCVTNGEPISNATVHIYSPNGDSLGETITDTDGYFEIASVPEYESYKAMAEYEVVSKSGEIVQLNAHGTADDCSISPFTSLVVAFGEQNDIDYKMSKQDVFTWLNLNRDPFIDAFNNETLAGVNLNALNYAMRSIPGGLSGWIDSVIEAYNKSVNPNQMWIEDIDSTVPDLAQMLWEDALAFNRGQTVKVSVEMVLKDPNAATKKRKLLYYRQSTDILNRDVFIHFLSPSDIQNTTYLHNVRDGSHKTYVYLSSFKKIRKIVGSDFGQLFFDTDFTYEDIKLFTEGTYTASYPLEVVYNEQPAYVLNIVKDDSEYTSYSSLDVTILKNTGLIVDVRMYDKINHNQLIKHLNFSDIQEVQGISTPMSTTMENLISGTMTELLVKAIEYNLELPADTFTERNMEK